MMFRFTPSLTSQLRLTKNTIQPISYKLSSIRSCAAVANIQSGDEGIPCNDNNLSQKTKDPEVKDKVFVPHSISNDGGASFMQYLASCEGLSNQLKNRTLRAECIVYHALVFEGCKAKNAGVNSMAADRGISNARKVVGEFLLSRARMVSTNEELAQIATRVAKGDNKIGELVAKGVEVVGKQAAVIISNSEASNEQLEFVNGMMVKQLFIERYCNLVDKNSTHVFKNPLILIHEDKGSIKSILKEAIDQAEDAPIITVGGFSERNKEMLQDIATLTGGQVLTKELDTNFTPQMFGSCKEVAKTKEGIAILGGSGDRTKIEERCEQLRSEIKTKDETDDLQLSLANLSNGAAVLKFAGKLDKLQQKKVLVDKALRVAKTVIESGVVDDCGVMFLHASKELDKLEAQKSDEKFGVQLVQNALKMPVYVAASAAGFNGSFVVQKLLEQDNPDLGYDLTRGEFLNVTEYGIAESADDFTIDFYKSVRDAQYKIDFDYHDYDFDEEED